MILEYSVDRILVSFCLVARVEQQRVLVAGFFAATINNRVFWRHATRNTTIRSTGSPYSYL